MYATIGGPAWYRIVSRQDWWKRIDWLRQGDDSLTDRDVFLGQLNVYIYLVSESKWVCFRFEIVIVLGKMSTDPKKMETQFGALRVSSPRWAWYRTLSTY